MTKPVFGKKADLVRYGILPVLLVVQNDRKQSLDLQDIEVHLEASDGRARHSAESPGGAIRCNRLTAPDRAISTLTETRRIR